MFAAEKFRRVALLGAALWLVGATRAADASPDPRYTGTVPIQEWTPEDTGGKPQSFSIIQHPGTGLIYVGNEAGVLEYDGARWRRLPRPEGSPPEGVVSRGLEFDDEGRLWAAAENDVLIYSPDALGHWQPQSLRAQRPAQSMPDIVWELRRQGGFMWGVTTNGLIRIDGRSLEVRAWPLPGRGGILGMVDDSVWFHSNGWQLMHTQGGEVGPAPAPALPETIRALGVTRTVAGVLQLEHAGGVLELRDGAWVTLSPELDAVLAGTASRVRRLPDGRRIFSTRTRTLVLADGAGRVLGRIHEPAGVNFGVTPATFMDRDGGLWMANASGIRRLQLDGAATRHGPAQGLRGGARRLVFDGSALLAATAQGLFIRDAATGLFTFQAGSPSDGQALLANPAGGWLVAAGRNFGEWRDGAMVTTPGAPEVGISLAADPREPGRVFVGYFNEVMIYRRSAAGWSREGGLKGMGASIYFMATDAAGRLWMSSSFREGVWRVTAADGDWNRAVVERMDPPGGSVPSAPWKVAAAGGQTLVFGDRGIWHEDKPGGLLVAAAEFAGLPRGAATPVLGVASGAGTIYVAGSLDLRDRFWRGTREQAGTPWRFTELLLPEVKGQVRFEDMRESPDGRTLWMGGAGAAYSIDLAATPAEFRPPAARWRGVRLLEATESIHGGARAVDFVTLPRAQRSLALEFSAPDLRVGSHGRTGIEYRTRAAGVDHDWTTWSAVAARELTNLPPGEVQVEVQARNHLGVAGPVAALVLTIPPFWWEMGWARALAVLAGAGVVAVVVRWFVRRQFQQRIALLEAQAAVQQERLRIARDMHDDLGSTLASIVHLSDRAPTAGEAAPALARVHEAARDLVQRTRDIVWAATPQHDSLESLIEQMAAHAERTLGDRGITVKVEMPGQVPEEAMPSAVRHDVFLAFKEAVNNAAKYSQARTATVRVTLQPEALRIELADDGVGFAAGEVRGTGHGLPNLRGRLAAFGGTADIASVPGRGTTVTLRVPRTARKA